MNPSVADNLRRIHLGVESACRRCGRSPADVRLVAVSKRQPVDRILDALHAGHLVFGENQVQEATSKAEALPSSVEWHLIGPLQSNKVKAAAGIFHTFHSVDREKIARRLDKACASADRRPDIFFQINIGSEPTKSGFPVDALDSLRPLFTLTSIRPVGLMAIPPYEQDPERARQWFRRLRELRDEVASWPESGDFPGHLSMGMSHDFEVAIEEGATHIRVGTDIFGRRST